MLFAENLKALYLMSELNMQENKKLVFKYMSIKKFYAKSAPSCKVTFSLANEIAVSANHANLAGDFNNWNTESIPMKKSKNGL